jgi:signal transduction histidine kinase
MLRRQRAHGLSAGFDYYLTKPVDFHELRLALGIPATACKVVATFMDKDSTNPAYRKVVADLRTCEERYRGLVDSIDAAQDARLQSAVETLRAEVRHRRRLEAELLTAVETERQRIGRDLHDDLCQRLGATAMLTSVLAKRINRKDRKLGAELAQIPKLINDTIETCRQLARGLHPVTLHVKGLPAAFDELAERMPRGIKSRWPKGKRLNLKPETALHLYRIAEEAAGNAVKHAQATEISVELRAISKRIVLVISDNGKGFDEEIITDGMGLRNMKYRASVIGAELTVGRRDGGGTQVRCRLPLSKT